MEPKVLLVNIDNNSLYFKTNDYKQTTVSINGEWICDILWDNRMQFVLDFEAFVAKYRYK